MVRSARWQRAPAWSPPLVVAVLLCPLLVGIEPVGGDPDLMYRPIKHELARHLRAGTLPYWSDHFGLGVPLVAESHAAAFYPPNWVLYRVLDVPVAYRLSLWLHFVALAIATYAYGRSLGLSPPGSVAAAIGFSLCGFQAVHSVHEPFYTLMPYVPLCLLLGDRFVTTGKADLARPAGAGLGRPAHDRTLPDPDVDRGSRAGDRGVEGAGWQGCRGPDGRRWLAASPGERPSRGCSFA